MTIIFIIAVGAVALFGYIIPFFVILDAKREQPYNYSTIVAFIPIINFFVYQRIVELDNRHKKDDEEIRKANTDRFDSSDYCRHIEEQRNTKGTFTDKEIKRMSKKELKSIQEYTSELRRGNRIADLDFIKATKELNKRK